MAATVAPQATQVHQASSGWAHPPGVTEGPTGLFPLHLMGNSAGLPSTTYSYPE